MIRRTLSATSSTLMGFVNSSTNPMRAKPLALQRDRRRRQADDGDAGPELLAQQADVGGVGEVAGDDDEVGLRALDLGANVVERAHERRLDPRRASRCALRRTAGSTSCSVMRTFIRRSTWRDCGPWPSRARCPPRASTIGLERREHVAHAARASRAGSRSACGSARPPVRGSAPRAESRARDDAQPLGDAGGLALDHGARRLGRHVARRSARCRRW